MNLWRIHAALLPRRRVVARLRSCITSGARRALLEHFGARIGPRTRLGNPLILMNAGRDFSRLVIGDNVFLGTDVLLDLSDRITIADDVTISMRALITTHTDVGPIPLAASYPPRTAAVEILRNVYIGAGAIVLPGVTIGPNAIVAAGAVVRESVPPGSMVGGVPARFLKPLPLPGS